MATLQDYILMEKNHDLFELINEVDEALLDIEKARMVLNVIDWEFTGEPEPNTNIMINFEVLQTLLSVVNDYLINAEERLQAGRDEAYIKFNGVEGGQEDNQGDSAESTKN